VVQCPHLKGGIFPPASEVEYSHLVAWWKLPLIEVEYFHQIWWKFQLKWWLTVPRRWNISTFNMLGFSCPSEVRIYT